MLQTGGGQTRTRARWRAADQPRALLPSDSPLRHGFSLCPLASTLPLPTLGPLAPPYLFCFCRSRSLREEEPRCWPFSSSSPAAFSTCPWTDVGSLAMRGATSQTPERSRELDDTRSALGYRGGGHGWDSPPSSFPMAAPGISVHAADITTSLLAEGRGRG